MAPKSDNLPFVGRQAELQKFREMLDSRDTPWLMWVIGPAGQGKSKFLEECLDECRNRKLTNSEIIDFFSDNLRTRVGILRELAIRFSVNDKALQTSIKAYENEVRRGENADEAVVNHALNEIEDNLVNALRRIRRIPIVLLVDTIEEMAEGLGDWFFEKLLPKLHPNICVVAGGRNIPLSQSSIKRLLGPKPHYLKLKPLSDKDVKSYLYRMEVALSGDAFKMFYRLTYREKGDSQPLLVGLAAKALKDDVFKEDDLLKITPKEFEEQLVLEPHRSDTPENFVILHLAHAYHGYTPNMLSHVYSLEKLGSKTYEQFLKGLKKFPYIKQYSETGITRLHDYVRERIVIGRWKIEDPDFAYRASLSSGLAAYFEKRIELIKAKKDATGNINELDALQLQRLYHLLFADRERAYGLLWDLLDVSWHAYKFDYMNSLLDMAHNVNEILKTTNKRMFDEVLESLEYAARAWMTLETFDTEKTIALCDKVLNDKAGVRRLKLTALVAKATALGRKGEYDKPIEMLREAFADYEDLLAIARAAENDDVEARASLHTEHGISTVHGILPERYLILNTIGVFLRRKGQFDLAKQEFEKSFDLSHAEGDIRWQASAATQIGTSVRYEGDIAAAYDRIYQGLALRRKLNQKGQIAFSLQALGMLQRDDGKERDARKNLNEALVLWQSLKAEGYYASVYRNLGWVEYLDQNYDAAEKYYQQAEGIYSKLNQNREISNLRYKQGMLWLQKGLRSREPARTKNLKSTSDIFTESIRLGRSTFEYLYVVLSLVGLARLALVQGKYKDISKLEEQIKQFEQEGYHFEPAYADLEEVLGMVAERKSSQGSKINYNLFDEATDHYCKMFVYLARFSSTRYRQRREFLREWLPSLADDLRHRACKRLIECWKSHPDLAENHPGFIATVKAMDDL